MKEISLYLIELRRNYRLSNNKNKDSILFKEIGFFGVVLTSLLYVSVYVCEVIAAYHFKFDVDLISLPMSVVIKDSVLCFFVIILSALPIIVSYSYIKENHKEWSNFWKVKNNNADIEIIVAIIFSCFINFVAFSWMPILESCLKLTAALAVIFTIIVSYFLFIDMPKNKTNIVIIYFSTLYISIVFFFIIAIFNLFEFQYCIIVGIAILSIILFFLNVNNSNKPMKLLCFLGGLFIIFPILSGSSFYFFTLQYFKPDQSFKYNEQDYILLRNYDGNLVAKKIGQEQSGEYCFNEEILYLPKDILKEGLTFKKINNVVADCEKLNALKLAAIKIVRKQDCEGYKVITIETERKQASNPTN